MEIDLRVKLSNGYTIITTNGKNWDILCPQGRTLGRAEGSEKEVRVQLGDADFVSREQD